jgi:hypothetical protein
MNTDRLIELLLKEVNQFWANEMFSYLEDGEGHELDDLIKEWENFGSK